MGGKTYKESCIKIWISNYNIICKFLSFCRIPLTFLFVTSIINNSDYMDFGIEKLKKIC